MAGLALILSVFLVCVLLIVVRWFRHRERMAMIDRGLVPDSAAASSPPGQPNGRALRRWGLGISILGLLLLCAAIWVAVPAFRLSTATGGLPSLGLVHIPGLMVVFMGVGLLILYVLAQPTIDDSAPAAAVPVAAASERSLEPAAPGKAGEIIQDAELEDFGISEDSPATPQEFKAPAED
jgi:hypothetical protein